MPSKSSRYPTFVLGSFSSTFLPPCSCATSNALSVSTFRKFRSNGRANLFAGLYVSSTPWFTPLGPSSVATPDQVNGSDFCLPGEANRARQNVALPSWPLLPFRLVDSSRTGCASGDQKRAGASIFCSAKRPVSVWIAGWLSLLSVVFLGSESHPRHTTARARTAFKPAFFRNVILADVIRVTPF